MGAHIFHNLIYQPMNIEQEIEILLKFYETNRSAIMARVGFRDNALMVYLGGVATIFGATIQTDNHVFLLIIPFLSLGLSAIVANHQYFIKAHVWHNVSFVGKRIRELGFTTNFWESTLGDVVKIEKRTRLLSDFMYILSPCLISIIVNVLDRHPVWLLIMFAILGTLISFFLLLEAFEFRNKITQNIRKAEELKK